MIDDDVQIVLIEDSDSDAELIIRALRKNGLANQIVRARDGVMGLRILTGEDGDSDQAIRPRFVLLDIKLPRLDGIEVLGRLKSDDRTRETPVVMLTSSNQERDIARAYALGANSFVTKPIKFDEFSRAVAEVGTYWMRLNVAPATGSDCRGTDCPAPAR